MKNLPLFYIGQKVVCVETNSTGFLKVGATYIITAIKEDCSCGISYGVNNLKPLGGYGAGTKIRCSKCDNIVVSDGIQYFLSSRFAPIQEANLPLMTFSQIKEKEKEKILINN